MKTRWTAAISVLLGIVVAILVNLVTGHVTVPLVCGLVIAGLSWAGLEAARAGSPARRTLLKITQKTGSVSGELTGAKGVPSGTDMEINQTAEDIQPGGKVTGFKGGAS